jgi:glutathione synthase/RimK-type ligase-like ATP-grasp enzyme
MDARRCCILNEGGGTWAFEGLARQLGDALWIDVSEVPRDFNYFLTADRFAPSACGDLFISFQAMRLASDKRLLAEVFTTHRVPTQATRLLGSLAEAKAFAADERPREWCVKFPTGCGATGHRILTPDVALFEGWPRPLVVQEFIRLERPEVYRMYAAGGELFGWVVRRFPAGTKPSPWVAHARGARYEPAAAPSADALTAARAALSAVGLLSSFGCVDLLRRPSGEWVVLEVGTDGQFNHVDRDLGLPDLESEIQRRIAQAFWARIGPPPWAPGPWHPRRSR